MRGSLQTYSLIVDQLRLHSKENWSAVILEWLSHYEGLEQFFEDNEVTPAEELLSALSNHVCNNNDDAHIAALLSSLDFLNWRVKIFEPNTLWEPLEISLLDFMDQHSAQAPYAWKWISSYPDQKIIADWLLAKVRT